METQIFIEKARELYKIQAEVTRLEKEAEMLKAELKSLTDDRGASAGGFSFKPQTRKGSIDYKQAAAEVYSEEDLERFRKEAMVYWKLELQS